MKKQEISISYAKELLRAACCRMKLENIGSALIEEIEIAIDYKTPECPVLETKLILTFERK
jgi:hypothetical protein